MPVSPSPALSSGNPYVGPRAFLTGEELPNRQRDVHETADLVISERVALLQSPSGAGKTSLIQAGVIGQLQSEGFRPLGPVRVDKPPPARGVRNRYVHSIAVYLLEQATQQQHPLDELTLPEVLVLAAPELADSRYRGPPPVLIIDQLEEALSLDPTDLDDKDRFFHELGQALEQSRLWALLAIREDQMGELHRYVRMVPGHLRARHRLDFLTREEAVEAVRGPAAARTVAFEDGAVEMLIEKLARTKVESPDHGLMWLPTPFVEPFQLQVVCRQLWCDVSRRHGRSLVQVGRDDVARVDIDGALRRYYDETVEAVARACGASQRDVREWIEGHLVTAQRYRSQTVTGPVAGPECADVLKGLQDAYLVRADTRAGTTWYELSHDRLIPAVKAGNWRWRRGNLSPWQVVAYEWHRTGHPSESLLTAEELKRASSQTDSGGLTDYERDFLRESEQVLGASRKAGAHRALDPAWVVAAVVGAVALGEALIILALLTWIVSSPTGR